MAKIKQSKRVPRADQKWIPFPKMKRIKVRPNKKAVTPESIIQAMVDRMLRANRVPFLRLPSNMYKTIYFAKISTNLKRWILHDLSGWSDNITFLPIGTYKNVKFCLTAFVENKSSTGSLHGKQKILDKELGYNICRDQSTLTHIINTAKELQEKCKTCISKQAS
jgi:hypothetical protein